MANCDPVSPDSGCCPLVPPPLGAAHWAAMDDELQIEDRLVLFLFKCLKPLPHLRYLKRLQLHLFKTWDKTAWQLLFFMTAAMQLRVIVNELTRPGRRQRAKRIGTAT
ncbi:hypothetical protein B7W85_16195 [Allorhizobium ampelinum]|nr:hypothetical protein B7W85_16195 [Allorhizobium ampelinum]